MGQVYEAFDHLRRAKVALKTITHRDADSIYSLKNEFRSLANLRHPNVVELYDLFGGKNDNWFFTMELVEGTPFDAWVRPRNHLKTDSPQSLANTLDESRLRLALPQLCEAIAAIHAVGKLHRDLKPSNVLVTREGRVVVLDFGLAVDPEPGGIGQTVREWTISGTPAYMAPEQAAGESPTAACDYYSLGVMLFEALTGSLPFHGSVYEVLRDKQYKDAPSVSSADIPADLAWVCNALLARAPSSRPAAIVLRALLGTAVSKPSYALERTSKKREQVIGRTTELAEIGAAYSAMRLGRPVALTVVGESGAGKTTLCNTFIEQLRKDNLAVVLTGRCHERERVPFKGLDTALDDASRFLRKLPTAQAMSLLPRDIHALVRLFPVLGRVEAVAQAPVKTVADPQELQQCAFTAFHELCARLRDRWPLVLWIDDAQWLDHDALSLLKHFLLQREHVPALLILCQRHEHPATIGELRDQLTLHRQWDIRSLWLGPLALPAAQALAVRSLGREYESRAADVAKEANGSPFFVEALSRYVSHGAVDKPLTLRGAVLAQIEELSAAQRRLLVIIAIAGAPLNAESAVAAAGADHNHVDQLQSARLISVNDNGQSLLLECYHDKVRSLVAETLDRQEAMTLHGRLLAVLEASSTADPRLLVIHAQGKGDPKASARYAVLAAERSNDALAFHQAAEFYASALESGVHSQGERCGLQTKLVEALANAGHGEQAAHAYIEAALSAEADEAIYLRSRAAEQFLLSGHVRSGKTQLERVLRALGLPAGPTPGGALVLLGLERVRLRLRGLSFRAQDTQLRTERRRELEILLAAVRGMQSIEVVGAAWLSVRYVRLALDSGISEHAARALASAAVLVALRGDPAHKPQCEMLLDRAQALAHVAYDARAIAWVQLVRGLTAYAYGDQRKCRTACEQVIQMLREQCSGVSYELGLARQFSLLSGGELGELMAPSEATALIDEAWRRGDVNCALAFTGLSVVVRLIQDNHAELRRHLDIAHERWQRGPDYTWLDWFVLLANLYYDVYLDHTQRAFERLQSAWPELERAGFTRTMIRSAMHFYRGASALAVARLGHPNASKLRALARASARVLLTRQAPLAEPYGHTLNAWLALDEARLARAIEHFRHALCAHEAAGMLVYGVTIRHILGELLGNEEGRALTAQAEASARRMRISNLGATARLLMMGLQLPATRQ
jgi:serine/threonine protein kinase